MENFNSRMFTTILISQIIFLKDSLYVSIESWKVYNPKMLKLVIAGWWGDSDSFFFLLICALIVSFLKISWVIKKNMQDQKMALKNFLEPGLRWRIHKRWWQVVRVAVWFFRSLSFCWPKLAAFFGILLYS